jgi:hypothetical protein
MNQAERWLGLLTDKLIRRGVHTSVQGPGNDIREWIATWNDNPRPFIWTKTADEILNTLADYLTKLGAGHPVNGQDLGRSSYTVSLTDPVTLPPAAAR